MKVKNRMEIMIMKLKV